MRQFFLLVLTLALASCAAGQTYTIDTYAGGGLPPTPVAATAAQINPGSTAVDAAATFISARATRCSRWTLQEQ